MTFHLFHIRSVIRLRLARFRPITNPSLPRIARRTTSVVPRHWFGTGHTVGMCLYRVTDLVEFLSGGWELARDIIDADGVPSGTFTGIGEFTARQSLLCYHESGLLSLGGEPSPAERSLRYLPERPEYCTVWFDDGHFFHDLRLDTGQWTVGHPCRQDHYRGVFEAFDSDSWRQSWHVSGPTKI